MKRRLTTRLLALLIAIGLSPSIGGVSQEWTGRVVAIIDGDTIIVDRSDGHSPPVHVRLWGIDAPELAQRGGIESREALRVQIGNQWVTVVNKGIDQWGRELGWVNRSETNINIAMVASGWAWWYAYFAPTSSELHVSQQAAQSSRIGVWKWRESIPPWKFRQTTHRRR